MRAGNNLRARIWRFIYPTDDSVGGALPSGTIVYESVEARSQDASPIDDNPAKAAALAEKVRNLRIFEDDLGKMNRSVSEVGGAILIVSQFTLYADCRKGNRPSFTGAAPPVIAEALYNLFAQQLRAAGMSVATGQFQSHMRVALVNDGPVTLVLEN